MPEALRHDRLVDIPRGPPRTRRRKRRERRRDSLALWRTAEPQRITAGEVARLARMISVTGMPHERRWDAARSGDASVAVAVAIDHLHRRSAPTPLTDIVVGNLLVPAKSGDAAAALVIGHALLMLARFDPSNPDLLRLAALWARRPFSGNVATS